MDRLESFGLLREVDSEAGTVTAVISTGDVARDGAIIEPDGWDFDNYRRNPVVLWMHDDSAMPFARTVDGPYAGEKELVAKARFDMEDPQALTALRKVDQGFINATSVRWLPRKTEVRKEGKGKDARDVLVFVEQELLEWSFVSIPADPGAMILRADGAHIDIEDYRPRRTFVMPDMSFLEPMAIDGAQIVPDPAPTPEPPNDLALVEGALAMYMAKRGQRPTGKELVIQALSRATGKTEQRIRRELAGKGR